LNRSHLTRLITLSILKCQTRYQSQRRQLATRPVKILFLCEAPALIPMAIQLTIIAATIDANTCQMDMHMTTGIRKLDLLSMRIPLETKMESIKFMNTSDNSIRLLSQVL